MILKNANAQPNLTFAFEPADDKPQLMAKKMSLTLLLDDCRIAYVNDNNNELIGWVLCDLNLLNIKSRGKEKGIKLLFLFMASSLSL